MFSRTTADVVGTDRDVHGEGWKSRRLVLARDGLPFSLHETVLESGAELQFTYSAHSETVYCVRGRGSVEEVAVGVVTPLVPGSLYSVAIGDEHIVRAETELTFVCVFVPPLEGREEAA